MLIGNAKAGKQTLLKYITKDESLEVKLQRNGKYKFVDSDQDKTRTILPTKKIDPVTGDMLVDCPSFDDHRESPIIDISANFLTKQVFSSGKLFKIVIVEPDNFLRQKFGKASRILGTLRRVAEMIPNVDALEESVGLVVTNVKTEDSDREFSKLMKRYLGKLFLLLKKSKGQENLVGVLKLLRILSSANENVAIQRRPNEVTYRGESPDYGNIRFVLFESLNFTSVQCGIKLRAKTQEHIKKFLLEPSKSLVMSHYGTMADQLTQRMENATKNMDLTIEMKLLYLKRQKKQLRKRLRRPKGFVFTEGTLLNVGSDLKYQSFFREFALELSKLDFYFSGTGSMTKVFYAEMHKRLVNVVNLKLNELINSYVFMIKLQKFLSTYNAQFKELIFNEMITGKNFRKFLALLKKNEFDSRQASLSEVAYHELNLLWQTATSTKAFAAKDKMNSDNYLVTGRTIVVSKFYHSHGSEMSNIVMTASCKIFIDRDMKLQNTHLTLIAPSIEVIGGRKFTLIGDNGQDMLGTATGHGKAGKPGFSSGSLTLIAGRVTNGRGLNVFLYGGNGGNGQNGGPGRDGSDVRVYTGSDDIRSRIVDRFGNDYATNGGKYCAKSGAHHSCHYEVMFEGGGGGSNGYNGGYGAAGSLAGEFFLLLTNNATNEIGTIKKAGENGKGGFGGSHGANKCNKIKLYAECWTYWLRSSLSSCKGKSTSCILYGSNKAGQRGGVAHRGIVPNYKYTNIDKSVSIKQYFTSVISNATVVSQLETRQFSKYLLHDRSFMGIYTLKWYYENAISLFTTRMHTSKLREMVNEFRSAFKVFKNTPGSRFNTDEYLTLEIAFVSQLDLIDSTSSKRQVVKITEALQTLSKDSKKIQENWKTFYKLNETQKSMSSLEKQISEGEKQTKKFMTQNLEELSSKLKNQVQEIIGKVNVQKGELEKNTKALEKQREDVKGNFWKRILLAAVKLTGMITNIFFPGVGTLISGVASVAENIAIKEHSTDALARGQNLVQLTSGIASAKKLVMEFKQSQTDGDSSRRQVYVNGLQSALSADMKLGSVFDTRLRTSLTQRLEKLQIPGFVMPEGFEEEMQDDLQNAETIMESKNSTALSTELQKETSLVQVAQVISTVSTEVVHQVLNTGQDAQMEKDLTQQIAANRETHERLHQYEEDLHNTLQPALDDMVKGFESFGNQASGKSDFMLTFQAFDMKMMVRKCISFIQKFTESFLEEQAEMVKILGDMESLLVAVMKNYEKVNEIKYKSEFTGLLSKLTTDCTRPDLDLCKLNLQLRSIVKTNVLQQEYNHLERAYRQVIFPIVNRKLEILSPTDVMDVSVSTDDSSVIDSINTKIITMMELLQDEKNWIKIRVDDKLHVSDFNPNFLSSRPFYTWHQSRHGDQIRMLLGGEPVIFIADVRHRMVKNAVKFDYITLNISSNDPQAARAIQENLKYLGVKLEHSGESHYRCQDNYYAINGEPLKFEHSFERNAKGESVSRNKLEEKYRYGDVPYSPYTVWTFQLVDKSHGKGEQKMFQLANDWAHSAFVELIGRGSYLEENAAACQNDLSKYFDVLD